MAIKDQCRGCKHFAGEYNVCPELNSVPDYNSHSCDYYSKKNSSINLSKPGEASCEVTHTAPLQPTQTPPVTPPSPSSSGSSNTSKGMFSNPFSFSGRIRRTEYCLSFLIYYIYCIIYNVVIEETDSIGLIIFMILTLIPMVWFFWAQGAKRCHDRDNSGFYQLVPFYIFVMMFGKGDQGANSYGDDPKA